MSHSQPPCNVPPDGGEHTEGDESIHKVALTSRLSKVAMSTVACKVKREGGGVMFPIESVCLCECVCGHHVSVFLQCTDPVI